MGVMEHRILSAATGALVGSGENHVQVEVTLHTRSEAHYHQLCEAVAASLGFDQLMEQRTLTGRYVRFTPLGTASSVSYPSITVNYYEEPHDGNHDAAAG